MNNKQSLYEIAEDKVYDYDEFCDHASEPVDIIIARAFCSLMGVAQIARQNGYKSEFANAVLSEAIKYHLFDR